MDFGLYEKLLDKELKNQISDLHNETRKVDKSESARVLATAYYKILRKILSEKKEGEKIDFVRKLNKEIGNEVLFEDDKNFLELLAVHDDETILKKLIDDRPKTSISSSTLFTGYTGPTLESELRREIRTADRIDFIVSFIKYSGLVLIYDDLVEFTKNKKLRIITTSYMGASDYKAILKLSQLPNTEVKISYDTNRTRLHAKAYYFERNTGFSTAYIGSSNISNPALSKGLEWNLKVSEYTSKEVIDSIIKTFETYWNDDEFRTFLPGEEEDKKELKIALSKREKDDEKDYVFFDLRPFSHQKEILEDLRVEREEYESYKNLVVAATGTGKTRTMLGLIYRLLKTGRFKRVLFLVDRSALGEQAQDVFREVKLEDLMTLDEIYNIKNLDDRDIDRETKIHVATVQSLVKRILYNEADTIPAVSDYDLIVVDEAHRGYILDKELSDDEMLYRNQDDFISKYRVVIDYFDAVKVAMTATPALHTSEIFGTPVFSYSYREAVIEGFLVDHDAPHTITTRLSTEGIVYEKGEIVVIYDPITNEVKNSDQLEDELKFEVEQFNRQVITESFNRTVLAEIANDLDPEGLGKTLVFAVDDNHADLIVKILKEIYEPLGVDNDAIFKITGSVGGGNKKKIIEAIKHFKNEKFPNIAVTVDLLTTGIDVPEITTIIFMRRVKSRILFEQMLGRATRLCPAIGKTHFEIYDPVGVYETLDPYSTMKPVVANPSTSYADLLAGLEVLTTEAQLKNQLELIIAKLQRSKRQLDPTGLAQFADLTGSDSPDSFIKTLRQLSVAEATKTLLKNPEMFEILQRSTRPGRQSVVVSDKDDELLSHTRGYGEGQKPQDYLDEFKTFINANKNKILALKLVLTSPATMTRESLKSLKLELDRNHFTEAQLNSAYKELNQVDIAADIISLIRQQAIGSALISHEERIHRAVHRLKQNHRFTQMESNWIDRIEKNLLAETILEPGTFDSGAFKSQGGFAKINKVFKNQLPELITELNHYLYDDGGNAAS